MKNIRKILTLFLILNLMASVVGINQYKHICNSKQSLNIAAIFSFKPTQDDCLTCSIDEVAIDNNSHCNHQNNDKHANSVHFSKQMCCSTSLDLLKLNILVDSIQNINYSFHTFTKDLNLIIENIHKINVDYNLKIIKHYSGISPPFISDFIQFLQSILE